MTEVLLPSVGMTMTEGTVNEWFVEDGAHIEQGEPLFELTTDKLANTIESPATGTVKLLVEAGSVVECGTPIAIIED